MIVWIVFGRNLILVPVASFPPEHWIYRNAEAEASRPILLDSY